MCVATPVWVGEVRACVSGMRCVGWEGEYHASQSANGGEGEEFESGTRCGTHSMNSLPSVGGSSASSEPG